ncbi:MAG: hypothetical protein E6Q97_30920 [Desulfurellales bacterium]|nr:MAG: hypothetical protein E6Q97_30920 [Desulfurellales bacterium]
MVAKFWVSIWFDGDDSFMIEAPSKEKVETALTGFWVEDYVSQLIWDGVADITVEVRSVDDEPNEVTAKLDSRGRIEWL